MEISDSTILEKFRDETSREYAFTLLVKKYQQRIYWHIRKMVIEHEDANDVVQNTFIKVWNGLKNFKEQSQLYTWLYRIATNEALTFLNQKKRRFAIPMEKVEMVLSEKLTVSKDFSGDEIAMKLQKAILTLPEKQRLVFNMRYYEETPYEEMSKIFGTSVGALKASFHIAVKKIEDILTGD